MPNPQSKEDLRRFLGMVNYLGKFVPDLSDITAPLRELLGKDAPWCFEAAHKNAIERLTSIITSEPVLKYFHPQLPTKVSTDTSTSGLRATLEQKLHYITQHYTLMFIQGDHLAYEMVLLGPLCYNNISNYIN